MSSDVIVIEDRVDRQCVRHVHLMSNTPFDFAAFPQMALDGRNLGEEVQECGVWHYRAEYSYRGALDIACVYSGGNFRRLVVWSLDGYRSVKMALKDAWSEYRRLFGGEPSFAFMHGLPSGVENGHEVGAMTLIEAEWMLERAVAVGGKE